MHDAYRPERSRQVLPIPESPAFSAEAGGLFPWRTSGDSLVSPVEVKAHVTDDPLSYKRATQPGRHRLDGLYDPRARPVQECVPIEEHDARRERTQGVQVRGALPPRALEVEPARSDD